MSAQIGDEIGSQSERAYQTLRREIIHGDLMPGDRLRAADLQERFRLGLTPIREALMRLAAEGMIDGENNRGSWVREVTRAELADVMETRRAIERICLARAIARGDTAWEGGIVSAFHVLSRTPVMAAGENREAASLWERHHRAFHEALVSACGSAWLMRFWNALVDQSERYRKIRLVTLPIENIGSSEVNRDHAALMEAVLARDPDRAGDLMDRHLARTEALVAAVIDRTGGTNP